MFKKLQHCESSVAVMLGVGELKVGEVIQRDDR